MTNRVTNLWEVHEKRGGHGEVGRNVLVHSAESDKEDKSESDKELRSETRAHWFVVKHEPSEWNDKNNPRAIGDDLLR